MSYDQLDFIADLYTPVLALMSLTVLISIYRALGLTNALIHMLLLGFSVAYIYVWMFVDQYLMIWSSLGLDYSTHTALALVFVVFLALKGFRLMLFAWLSMLLYAGLMVYQNYHSVLDIVSTGGVIAPVLVWLLVRRESCGQAAG